MPDKDEKQRRKQIRRELMLQQQAEFENSLPMERDLFQDLFDFLDLIVTSNGCDNTLRFTELWLEENGPDNTSEIIQWLKDHGGYCDCEVLMNVEDYFQ